MAAPVTPIRQRTQYSCGAASLSMALKALGCTMCDEDKVNEVMGAAPMQGAAWEQIAAAANHYGCRSTLVVPATLAMVKKWTDSGKPVLIGWNPEGRPWSHASLVFDVTDTTVFVADPNCPDPSQTVREESHADFYRKWAEEWNGYKVRRPAMLIDREVDSEGRQLVAAQRTKVAAMNTKNPRAPAGKFTVDLSIGPNPDYGERWPVEKNYAVVPDLKGAVKVFRDHVSQMVLDGLGDGNNYGRGTVRDDKGIPVARVSWNGRLWEVGPQGQDTMREMRLANGHEADSDGSYMSVGYLKALADKSETLLEHIHQDTPLPDWVEAKIGQAANAINGVHDYFVYRGKDEGSEMKLEDQYTLLPQSVTARFEEGKSVDVPKYLREHGNPEAAEEWVEQNEANRDKFKTAKLAQQLPSWDKTAGVVDQIRGGDRVTILTPQGQQVSGTAVMKGPAGWVLNMGGKHGRPGIATEENIVKVVPTKNPRPTFRAASQEVLGTMMARMAVGDIPADVERYVKEIKESNPDYDEAKTWATAWSIYCKYKNPGSDHCSRSPSEYLTKQACGELEEAWGETLDEGVMACGEGVMADWEEGSVISPPTSGPGTAYTEMWGSDTPDGLGNEVKRAFEEEGDSLFAGLDFMAEGCPDNLDEAECGEWEANTEKYKNVVKDQHKAARQRLSWSRKANLEDACWEGYEAIGMKELDGKQVPNCVPKQASLPTTVQGWLEWED